MCVGASLVIVLSATNHRSYSRIGLLRGLVLAQGKSLHEDANAWATLSTVSLGIRKKIQHWHLITYEEAVAATRAIAKAISATDYSLSDLVMCVCLAG